MRGCSEVFADRERAYHRSRPDHPPLVRRLVRHSDYYVKRPTLDHGFLRGLNWTTRPLFITNATRRTAVISSRGLPCTATRSASKPGATVPILAPSPSDSAATEVPLRSAAMGLSPPSFTR